MRDAKGEAQCREARGGGGSGGGGAVEVLGEPQNELPLLHPLYNLRASRVEAARAVFAALPDPLL